MRKKAIKKTKKKESVESGEEKVITRPNSETKREEVKTYGHFEGKLSLIQSTYGNKGNFELVVPLRTGGIAHYTRDNDVDGLPWKGPTEFGIEAGLIDSVSMIQSNFGTLGNLEIVALDQGASGLMHFWRDSMPSSDWHGPTDITKEYRSSVFSGNPAMIKSNFGNRGNFFVVVPRSEGGFSNYWRDNDDPALPWHGPFNFALDSPVFEAVTLIQSNFGDGNLEMVARSDDKLAFFWRDASLDSKWNGPEIIAKGVTGTPALIQSTFGNQGNFELVVPMVSGGLSHYWRDNDDSHLSWHGPFMFAMNMGKIEALSLIQSNFGEPGHLEVIALIDGQLVFFWRDSGPDFRWVGPYYLNL